MREKKWETTVIETILFLLDKDSEQCDVIADLATEKHQLLEYREALNERAF